MAQFAAPTPDENLSPGWNVQGTGTAQAASGAPGAGYAQSGAVPASPNVSTASQPGAGVPNPPGALNVGGENSGSYAASILTNPGYADGTTLRNQTATGPVPTTAGVQQPFGVSSLAAITVPISVTAVAVAPFSPTGISAATFTTVWSGTSTAAQIINVTVPAGGYVKMTGANATSVAYTTN